LAASQVQRSNVSFLRHKILYIHKNFGLQPWLGSSVARKHIVKVFADAEPLNDWLKRNA
jgi:hypothetical protein